jgi:hypothetical protein
VRFFIESINNNGALQPTATMYEELYADPTKNQANEFWRSTHNPLTVEALHQNILADFSRPIKDIGVFVDDDESGTGRLKLLHGLHSFPGTPGHSRDRMVTMTFEGDVVGIGICAVAFDPS